MNIPNVLTALRIFFIPIVVVFFYLPFDWSKWAAASLFLLAGITDWFDGFLARRLNQTTAFGAFLDPVADKLMVVVTLALLVGRFSHIWLTIPAIIIIGREIMISSLREWMAEIGKYHSVAVNFMGKLKTFMQMCAIFLLLLGGVSTLPSWIGYVGIVLLYFSALLTLWSMCLYVKAAWPDLNPFNYNQ